jgi:hypothetical protein
MRAEVQVHLRDNEARFEGALLYNASEENFEGTEEEMVEFSYSAINNITIRILRPDGTWNTIVEGDMEIELYFRDHYKPIVQTTPKEKSEMRDREYREAKKEEIKKKDRAQKRKRAEKKKEEDEEKPSEKKK